MGECAGRPKSVLTSKVDSCPTFAKLESQPREIVQSDSEGREGLVVGCWAKESTSDDVNITMPKV
jgi:hypothetical protein